MDLIEQISSWMGKQKKGKQDFRKKEVAPVAQFSLAEVAQFELALKE